jgi:hypothetical protein
MRSQPRISRPSKEWIEPLAQSLGAPVLVTDDADGFKTVADEVGVPHQVCKAHVKRNTEELIEPTLPLAASDADGSFFSRSSFFTSYRTITEQQGFVVYPYCRESLPSNNCRASHG